MVTESVLVLSGIIIMFLSSVGCLKLIRRVAKDKVASPLYTIGALIVFFLIGYLIYFLTLHQLHSLNTDLLLSFILFFGAIFVAIVLISISHLISRLKDHASNLEKANQLLIEHQINLKASQEELAEKNKELQKTMEDFYTLRLSLEGKSDSTDIAAENQTIKAKINQLKKTS